MRKYHKDAANFDANIQTKESPMTSQTINFDKTNPEFRLTFFFIKYRPEIEPSFCSSCGKPHLSHHKTEKEIATAKFRRGQTPYVRAFLAELAKYNFGAYMELINDCLQHCYKLPDPMEAKRKALEEKMQAYEKRCAELTNLANVLKLDF